MIRFGVCAATFGLTVSAGVALRGMGRCENDGPARPRDREFTAEQKSDEERAGKTSLTAAIREGRKMVQRRKVLTFKVNMTFIPLLTVLFQLGYY